MLKKVRRTVDQFRGEAKGRESIQEVINSFHVMTHVMVDLNEMELSTMKMALSHLIKLGNQQLLYYQNKYGIDTTMLGYEKILQLDLVTCSSYGLNSDTLLIRCNRIYEDARNHFVRELVKIENSI